MAVVALIIDMQVDFFKKAILSRSRPALASRTNQLVAAVRALGVPIIWVKQEFSPDLSDAPLEVKRDGIKVTITGTPGARLLPELDICPSDLVLVKKRYSAFFGTNLDRILKDAACSQLVVAGINTHACVRSTVVDAYQRDFEVLLARDCIASHDEEHGDVSWRYMEGKLGRGLRNAELVKLLSDRAGA